MDETCIHGESINVPCLACPGEGELRLRSQRAPITEVEKEMNDPDLAKLENWFTYHAPTPEQVGAYQQIRDAGYMMARTLVLLCPPSADRTVALRKVREAVTTANAAIACGGK